MILLWAVIIGLLAGSIRAWVGGRPLISPDLRLIWLVPVALVPQVLAFYIPTIASIWADNIVATGLVVSQMLLLVFVWFNRRQPGFWLLSLGLALNLLVIILNGGLMPISPETVTKLLPNAAPNTWELGSRLGRSKDIVLPVVETRLWLLSDRFLLTLPNRVAFSLGDVFVATSTIWFLWAMGGPKRYSSPMLNFLCLLRQN